ncbi:MULTISPECIES: ABC transporter ATP-binding protein [Desulfosediminicola]|uniref:ABC transporter ATP-binding protein n=1 Tax=Desulfosediminicola TaxID=2886823 RepID=UPI0010AD34DE|nr:ABC transporter ATP-binding protein [Desulfosediminicola ganghwensis]
MSALFEARNLSKTYHSGSEEIHVLDQVNISISAGEMAAIVGASGSGKTTLLQILGTLASPSSGELYFKNDKLNGKNDTKMAAFRNNSLGFIFQFHHLLPEFSALENVMMPGLINGQKRKDLIGPATSLLKRVELDHRLDHRVAELSGGEQQRTALARALIMNPAILLADEPTGNLDSRAGDIVFRLLEELCRERSLAVIMVTHNMDLAARMDITYTLKDGKIEE